MMLVECLLTIFLFYLCCQRGENTLKQSGEISRIACHHKKHVQDNLHTNEPEVFLLR